VLKDWEVGLGVVGDYFFVVLPKILDWESVLGTLGDALNFLSVVSFSYV
jgi:hypothetical protein